MKRNMSDSIKMISNTVKAENITERKLNQREKNKKVYTENKWKVIQEVHRLLKEGYSKSEVSTILKISRQTVYKYMVQEKPLEKDTYCILDEYIPRIKELMLQKYKMKDILSNNKKRTVIKENKPCLIVKRQQYVMKY